jgi:hypothetical protein
MMSEPPFSGSRSKSSQFTTTLSNPLSEYEFYTTGVFICNGLVSTSSPNVLTKDGSLEPRSLYAITFASMSSPYSL